MRSKDIKIGKKYHRVDVEHIVVLYDTSTNEFNTNIKSICSVDELTNLKDALQILLKHVRNEK